MSNGSNRFLDAAIVSVLQYDSIASRKTLEWITDGDVDLSDGKYYKVMSRKPIGTEQLNMEIDLGLKNVESDVDNYLKDLCLSVSRRGHAFTVDMHVEVETSGRMNPLRMFMYDYEIALNTRKGKGPLVFPTSYVVFFTKSSSNQGCAYNGITALYADGVTPLCDYRYRIVYLDRDARGTLLAPIQAAQGAMGKTSVDDALSISEGIISAVEDTAEGIDEPALKDKYRYCMKEGLAQHFKCLRDILVTGGSGNPEAERAARNIDLILQPGGEKHMYNIFEEARQAAKRSDQLKKAQEIKNNEDLRLLVETYGLSEEQARHVVYREGTPGTIVKESVPKRGGVSGMNLR